MTLPYMAGISSDGGSHKHINFNGERQKYIFLKYGKKWKNAFDSSRRTTSTADAQVLEMVLSGCVTVLHHNVSNLFV